MNLKKIIFLITLSVACFAFTINVKAYVQGNIGSTGDGLDTSGSSANCSEAQGCIHNERGIRVTLVDENGDIIHGTYYVDFWDTLPTNARGKVNSKYRSAYVNNFGVGANSENFNNIGDYIKGDVTNDLSLIGGLISYENQHQLIENEIKREFENYKKSNKCEEFKFFEYFGYKNFCDNLKAEDCGEILNNTYVLIEPMYYVNYKRKNVALTGTELAAMIYTTRILNQDNTSTYNLNKSAFDNAIINMYLTERDDQQQFKSRGRIYNNFDKYVNDFQDVNINDYKDGVKKRIYDSEGTLVETVYIGISADEAKEVLKAAIGYSSSLRPLGNSMHLVWLDTLAGDYCEQGECCVPDPNIPDKCCDEDEIQDEDGFCISAEKYWETHQDIYNQYCTPCCIPNESNDYCCNPSNVFIFEDGFCKPYNEFWNGKTELYNRYCIQECPPLTLTTESYCKLGDCDEPDNVSIFADPILKEYVTDNGKVDVSGILNKLNNNVSELVANKNDTFLAVAYQGETYRKAIDYNGRDNDYCDLYCQEVAIVTLPDVYPAANAGRYFQWSISTEEIGTLVTQEIIKVCAEDIKYDDFMKDYISFNEETVDKVKFVSNYEIGDLYGIAYCGPLEVFNNDGITCETAGDIREGVCVRAAVRKFNSCMASCCHTEDDVNGHGHEVCDGGCQEGCRATLQLAITQGCPLANLREQDQCQSASSKYEIMKTKWENGYPETKKEKFDEFLSCFSNDINSEIVTDLNLDLYYGDTIYDSSFYEKVEGEVISNSTDFFCQNTDDCNTKSYYSADTLFGTTNFCNNESFDYREVYDSINNAALTSNASIEQARNNAINAPKSAIEPQISINFSVNIGCAYGTNGINDITKQYDCIGLFSHLDPWANSYVGKGYNFSSSVSFSKAKKRTLKQSLASSYAGYDVAGYNENYYFSQIIGSQLLPEEILNMSTFDFYLCSNIGPEVLKIMIGNKQEYDLKGVTQKCYNYYKFFGTNMTPGVGATDKSSSSSTCYRVSDIYYQGEQNKSFNSFPLSVNGYSRDKNEWLVSDYTNELTNIDYKKTLRFITLQKKDGYKLSEFVNACTCSDGTVMDAEIDDDGNLYCPCEPEIFENNYDNSSSGVDADLIETDTYGFCKYSAYDTIDVGGTYSIAYMTGSGTYPLTIDYSNIGSIEDDVGHFEDLIEKCGCSGSTCTYEGDMCKISIGNSIMHDSWSYQDTFGWSLKASYFICKDGECYEPKCPPGECPNPTPIPDPEPSPVCPDGGCVDGLALIYRTVDLNNPFPGGNNNSDTRTAGENWLGSEDRITNNRGISGSALYSSNEVKPLYYFKFTPSLIKDIRAYNVSHGRDYAASSSIAYVNNKLRDDEGNYNVGFSQILRNDIAGIFAETASLNGDSLDDWFKIIVDTDDCNEDESVDTYCYEISTSWSEYIRQGDEECWDLAKNYLGVR